MIYYTYLHSNYGYFLSFFTIFPLGIKYIYWRYWLKNKNNSKIIKTIRDPLIEYCVSNKNRFMKIFEISESHKYNSNIDPIFYNKDEYKKMMTVFNNDLEREWKTRILFESTPRGNILMFYDTYKQGFSYYCDSNSMPYYLLNAVAMKYVMVFYCLDFFVDNNVTEKYIDSPLVAIYSVEEKKKEDITKKLVYTNKNAPFIKAQKYGPTILRNLQDVKTAIEPNIWNMILKMFSNIKKMFFLEKIVVKTIVSETKSYPVLPIKEYNFNRFTYWGKINNFDMLQKNPKKSSLNGFTSNLLDNIESEGKLQKMIMNYKDYKLRSGEPTVPPETPSFK